MRGQRRWQGKVFIATSLDGYLARADGDIAWLTDPPAIAGHAKPPADPPVIPRYAEHLASVDHLVMGRGTYEKVLTFGFWPYPQQQVIVLSRTLTTDDSRVTVAASTDEALTLLAERASTAVYVDGGKVIADWLRLCNPQHRSHRLSVLRRSARPVGRRSTWLGRPIDPERRFMDEDRRHCGRIG